MKLENPFTLHSMSTQMRENLKYKKAKFLANFRNGKSVTDLINSRSLTKTFDGLRK